MASAVLSESQSSVYVVEVVGLSKAFGAIEALRGVDLTIAAGEVHGLVGANGAGKSTLVNCLAGVVQPDAGEIRLNGTPCRIRDARDATDRGLSFIHQELSLIPKFTALQNMAVGQWRRNRFGLVDWPALRQRANEIAQRLGFDFSADEPIEKLSMAQRWFVSIGRALMTDAQLVAMDEPTAALSSQDAERVFGVARELTGHGVAVLYISHRLEEVRSFCDRVTVLRDGAVAAALGRSPDLTALFRAITGAEMSAPTPHERTQQGEALLEGKRLRRYPAVRDASLEIHRGEVVGLAGLVGAGRTELARLLFGVERPDAGQILLDGAPVSFRGPHDAIKAGIALVPEERRSQGLLMKQSVAWNIGLPSWDQFVYDRAIPLINRRELREVARSIVQKLHIVAPSVDQSVSALSGGNQQKVVIAKWLVRRPRVLILDEPTRGVDVGARAGIYALIRSIAQDGVAVLLICSDFEELTMCDRVLIMVEGAVVGELVGADISEERMLQLCYASENAS